MPAEMDAEESTEEVETPVVEAELKAVKVASPDGSDNTKSPVASANMKDMGAAPSVASASDEKGGSAPAPKDMGASNTGDMKEVKADNTDGSDSSAKSPVASK
jgi:hypothetical protein